MGTRHPEHPRADGDFYTEPAWTVAALFRHVQLYGGLHDPCCGVGTVIDTAHGHGMEATGADIADRARGRFAIRDFLNDGRTYPNIISTPPYKLAQKVICHALNHVEDGGYVAALVPLGFLASQRRYPLDSHYGVYVGDSFNRKQFAAWLAKSGIPWPRLPSGQLQLEQQAFKSQAEAYPVLAPLRRHGGVDSPHDRESTGVGAHVAARETEKFGEARRSGAPLPINLPHGGANSRTPPVGGRTRVD